MPVAILHGVSEADGGVADDTRVLLDRGPERRRVLRGRRVGVDHEVGRVRVDDRGARVDAGERVGGLGLDGRGDARVAARDWSRR